MKYLILVAGVMFFNFSHAEGPCEQDRKAHCSGVEVGDGKMAKCMKDNESKLSTDCKAFISEAKEQRSEVKEACHADAEKLCSGKKKRELMKCLRAKKDQVSESCKNEWQKMKDLKHKKSK